MKNKSLVIFGIALIGAISLQSCTIEGCTDKKAANYDAEANSNDGSCEYLPGCTDATAINYSSQAGVDDGSCEFEGQAIFWTKQLSSSDTITVSINGTPMGYMTQPFNHPPDCGSNGTVTIALEPGMYGYRAVSTTGRTWHDSVYIYKNFCEDIELAAKK